MSAPLSPILYLFLIPYGVLYQKVQHLLAEEEIAQASHSPAVIKHRRPGPKRLAYGIPTTQWPTVVQRIVEQKEPLRNVADDHGISHETIRRIMLYVQKCGRQEV